MGGEGSSRESFLSRIIDCPVTADQNNELAAHSSFFPHLSSKVNGEEERRVPVGPRKREGGTEGRRKQTQGENEEEGQWI